MRNSTTYFHALTLFDKGAYTSFVNRKVAKWLHGGTEADMTYLRRRSAKQARNWVVQYMVLKCSTFFNEVTKSDNILKNIETNVIDSCIELIIGMTDIRSHRLVHRIPRTTTRYLAHEYSFYSSLISTKGY